MLSNGGKSKKKYKYNKYFVFYLYLVTVFVGTPPYFYQFSIIYFMAMSFIWRGEKDYCSCKEA